MHDSTANGVDGVDFRLLCWPVLYPQMVGGALFPGEVMVNVSMMQSPMLLAVETYIVRIPIQ